MLVSKYADHLPLYRQAKIYDREGVELERSTLTDWVAASSALLKPLVDAIGHHVTAAGKLHADDTPVPVLGPGRGKARTGRIWTYVRDDRLAGNETPPAVWFCYSPDRKGIRSETHLKPFAGVLQARRRRPSSSHQSRSVDQQASDPWPSLQELIESDGTINIGSVEPVPCTAIAAQGRQVYAMLRVGDHESLTRDPRPPRCRWVVSPDVVQIKGGGSGHRGSP